MSNHSSQKQNLLNFDRAALAAWFEDLGERSFRASQVMKWIHQRGIIDFDAMTDLNKSLRVKLGQVAEVATPEVLTEHVSQDGTYKWLLKLEGGNCIETVFIPETDRGTLCISSQVGCALECSFCATGYQGFNRNLSVAEIIAQVWLAHQVLGFSGHGHSKISNIVLMGMGEPLLNFENVVSTLNILLDDDAYGLSKRRVTLSTSGVVPAMQRLRAVADVSLAVSLHAPNDELRNELVPLNKKYPIDELLVACDEYVSDSPRKKVTYEYVMLKGINDSVQHAKQLVRLLEGRQAKVNLIPFNPFPESDYARSPRPVIDRFRDILVKAGVVTITRKTRGDDIDGACGQLAGDFIDKTRRQQKRAAVHTRG